MRPIALIPGHPAGYPGSVFDLDGDGKIEISETEAARNRVLAESIRQAVVARNGRAHIFDEPSYYASRHAALAWMEGQPGIVVHVHHDSGKGRMVMYDRRSSAGTATATRICRAVSPVLPGCRSVTTYDDRDEPHPWLYRAWSLVQALYPVPQVHGVVLELVTVREPPLLDTLLSDHIAEALLEDPCP